MLERPDLFMQGQDVKNKFTDIDGKIGILQKDTDNEVSLLRSSAKLDGTTDDTIPIQTFIDSLTSDKVVKFPQKTIRTGKIKINKSTIIDGGGAKLKVIGNIAFELTDNVEYLIIKNFSGFDFEGAAGLVDAKAIYSYQKSAKHLVIEDNFFGYSAISLNGDQTSNGDMVPKINRNRWKNDNTIINSNPLLFMTIGYNNSIKKFAGWIMFNDFDCWVQNGNNQDIIKIGQGSQAWTFGFNRIKNSNLNSQAEMDTFTGSDKLKIVFNTFENVALKRQQIQGTTANLVTSSQDSINENTFIFREGALNDWGVLLRGSMFTFSNNNILVEKSTSPFSAVYLNESDVAYDEFTTKSTTRFSILGNNVDLRKAHTDSIFLQGGNTNLSTRGNIGDNRLVGGGYFISPRFTYSVFSSNSWFNSSNAKSDAFDMFDITNTMSGNYADHPIKQFPNISRGSVDFKDNKTLTREFDATNAKGTRTTTNYISIAPADAIVKITFGSRSSTSTIAGKYKISVQLVSNGADSAFGIAFGEYFVATQASNQTTNSVIVSELQKKGDFEFVGVTTTEVSGVKYYHFSFKLASTAKQVTHYGHFQVEGDSSHTLSGDLTLLRNAT